MPTYDYRCGGCGHTWEVMHSIKADPLKECPNCKEEKAERIITGGGGVLFKGPGFYQTDYRSDQYKADKERDKD